DEIRAGVPVFAHFFCEVEALYPQATDKLKFNEALKRVLNHFVVDLIENTRARMESSGVRTLEDVRAHPERLAAFSPDVENERRQAKEFLYENVYFSPSLASEKEDAERVVTDLFAFWMKNPAALPPNYQDKAEEDSLPRVVCDYIAGMTDNFI